MAKAYQTYHFGPKTMTFCKTKWLSRSFRIFYYLANVFQHSFNYRQINMSNYSFHFTYIWKVENLVIQMFSNICYHAGKTSGWVSFCSGCWLLLFFPFLQIFQHIIKISIKHENYSPLYWILKIFNLLIYTNENKEWTLGLSK